MVLILVGGHSRNVGKTSVMVGLLRGLSQLPWTAVKITQFGHDICTNAGTECDCSVATHPYLLTEETAPLSKSNTTGEFTDTARFLAAGAVRSLWLRTRQGELALGLPALQTALQDTNYVMIESNSLRQFWKPQLYIQVFDPRNADFKLSAQRFADLADLYVVVRKPLMSTAPLPNWQAIFDHGQQRGIPVFPVNAQQGYISPEIVDYVQRKITLLTTPTKQSI
jgi:hypothetical protein